MSVMEQLKQSIDKHPAGCTLAELMTMHPQIARRTAQRWLSELVAAGRVRAIGDGRARRYSPAVEGPLTCAEDVFPAAIALSVDSRDILAYLDKPIAARAPVGYQDHLLEDYQPNQTAYLPEGIRRHLYALGQTTDIEAAAGTYSRAILNRLLIDLSWASSHLEGNTYSRLDTRELIEHGTAAMGKPALETQMILNHKAAIELLVENIEDAGFNGYTLMNLHSVLAENLLPNRADEGRLRLHPVSIGKSAYRPLATPQAIEARLALVLAKANAIHNPFEQSFFAMVHLPYLQPFADINKRTSRLMANLPLFKANLCPLTFLDVPETAYSRAVMGVYELARVELLRDLYVWAYERSTREYLVIRQELAEPDPLRLAWRSLIKRTVKAVVLAPAEAPLPIIASAVAAAVPGESRLAVQATIVEELRRIHEGVLARYGLRPSDLAQWLQAQQPD